MSTYSITAFGPSGRLAMLRTLAVKLGHQASVMLQSARITFVRTAAAARTLATGTIAAVASPTGYRTLINLTSRAVSWAYRATRAVARWTGRNIQRGLDAVTHGISSINADAGAVFADFTYKWIVTPVTTATATADRWLTRAGNALREASLSPMVTAVTTRVAQIAALLLGVHAISRGAVAARIVQLVPAAMEAVLWLTNPASLVLAVGGAFAVALGLTLAMAHIPSGGLDSSRLADLSGDTWDLADLTADLTVDVNPDGSVEVRGLPATLPREIGAQVATTAAEAAVRRLERMLITRRTLTRDDRRALNKVAREAVRGLPTTAN